VSVDYLKLDEQAVTPGALPSRETLNDLCYGTGQHTWPVRLKLFKPFFMLSLRKNF